MFRSSEKQETNLTYAFFRIVGLEAREDVRYSKWSEFGDMCAR